MARSAFPVLHDARFGAALGDAVDYIPWETAEIVLAAGHGPHCRCLQYLAAQGGLTAQQILYRVMLSLGYPHLACAIWLKPDVYIGAVKHLSVGVAIIEWGAELRRRSELDIGQPMTLFAQRMAEAHA